MKASKKNTRSPVGIFTAKTPFILVSTSPRRISLLGDVRLPIEIESPNTDETAKRGESPKQLVSRLAREKAESAVPGALKKHSHFILLAADTIVVAPNGKAILGKPKNAKDALRMMRLLSGKTHTVLTGYCILGVHTHQTGSPRKIVRVVKSRVKMRAASTDTLKRYIATGEPMDKAGSYGAQGLGMAFIEKIDGSYTNVVGLPIAQVLADLEKLTQSPLFGWLQ